MLWVHRSWWALSYHQQNRTVLVPVQRCHTTVLASSAFGYVWWVTGAHWLWLQASSRQGFCSCVCLILCLPFHRVCLLEHRAALTLLLITYVQADLHPEIFEHRTSVIYTVTATQSFSSSSKPVQPICTWFIWGVIWMKIWEACSFLLFLWERQCCFTFVL